MNEGTLRLYMIPQAVRESISQIEYDPETGTCSNEQQFLDILQQSQDKIIGAVFVTREYDRKIKAVEERIRELQGAKESLRGRRERLKQLITHAMRAVHLKTVRSDTEGITATVTERPKRIYTDDEEAVARLAETNPDLVTVRMTTALNKDGIWQAVERNGGQVPEELADIIRIEQSESLTVRTPMKRNASKQEQQFQET